MWPSSGNVHLYWRCHNKEFYLENDNFKDLYLYCVNEGLEYKSTAESVKIHAYCTMGNHFHMSTTYLNGSHNLSNYTRYAHGNFGMRYNKRQDRSGKVAQGRPKTQLVQNDEHAIRVHFYIEANPIRAKFRTVNNLKYYRHSSFGFYAYGIKTKFTHLLTIPQWYLNLGPNPRSRQAKYREMFARYLKEDSQVYSTYFQQLYIGDAIWINSALKMAKKLACHFAESSVNGLIDPTNTE